MNATTRYSPPAPAPQKRRQQDSSSLLSSSPTTTITNSPHQAHTHSHTHAKQSRTRQQLAPLVPYPSDWRHRRISDADGNGTHDDGGLKETRRTPGSRVGGSRAAIERAGEERETERKERSKRVTVAFACEGCRRDKAKVMEWNGHVSPFFLSPSFKKDSIFFLLRLELLK